MTVVQYSTPGVSRIICSALRRPASGALERCSIGELNDGVDVALVLLGQKTAGHACQAEQSYPRAHHSENDKSDHGLADNGAGHVDVAFGGTSEHTVEPAEEPAQRTRASFFGRSRIAQSAGLRVRALKADKSTEMAMVTANCV